MWNGTGAAEENRAHGAHEHGQGTLDIVAAADELVLELRVPAVNVVGFEHEPGDDEQRRAVSAAIEKFSNPMALFEPTAGAKCRVEAVHVELAGMKHGDDEGHGDEHSEKHDDHDDEHSDEHEGHKDETHSELEADYQFHCDEPQALEDIAVKVFEYLPGAEAIETRVVTETMQSAVELTPDSTVLRLKR